MAEKKKLGKMCKERMTEEVLASFKERPNFIITTFMGSSVADLEILRKNLKRISSEYLVVKNSVLKVVFDKLKLSEETSKIESGMGISFSGDDLVASCKTVVTFAKDHSKFKIKGAVMEGKSITVERINELAKIPARNVLLTQIVVTMKSPITGFVNVLSGTLRKFVYCVDAIRVQKSKSVAAVPAQSEPAAADAAQQGK